MFLFYKSFFEIPLDKYRDTTYNVIEIQKGGKMTEKSRAEYFRERRRNRKDFSVLIPKEKYNKIDKKLKEQGKTKTEWLIEKIDEETK